MYFIALYKLFFRIWFKIIEQFLHKLFSVVYIHNIHMLLQFKTATVLYDSNVIDMKFGMSLSYDLLTLVTFNHTWLTKCPTYLF